MRKMCLPNLRPSRTVLAARFALFSHLEFAASPWRVFAPGPKLIPRCLGFARIWIPSRLIAVVRDLSAALVDAVATVFPLPSIAHICLRETFM